MDSLKGIGLFTLEVVALISSGENETIEEIEKHIEKEDVVEYIANKYDYKFNVQFDGSIYNNSAINRYFANYVGYIPYVLG